MRYFVYKTTCIPTQKYYIGVHSERRASDGYIGCGVCSNGTAKALKRKGIKSAFIDSVIKYGYENFNRELIKEFNSASEAYDFEKSLITEELLNSNTCLNIKPGGIGGSIESTCKPISILNCKTGEVLSFKSQADCASFLGVKNISGKKYLLNKSYIVYVFNEPISIKKPFEDPIYFYDINEASKLVGVKVHSLKRLLDKKRKSCKGWFLSDFDFSSDFYKHAKLIRKNLLNLQNNEEL